MIERTDLVLLRARRHRGHDRPGRAPRRPGMGGRARGDPPRQQVGPARRPARDVRTLPARARRGRIRRSPACRCSACRRGRARGSEGLLRRPGAGRARLPRARSPTPELNRVLRGRRRRAPAAEPRRPRPSASSTSRRPRTRAAGGDRVRERAGARPRGVRALPAHALRRGVRAGRRAAAGPLPRRAATPPVTSACAVAARELDVVRGRGPQALAARRR